MTIQSQKSLVRAMHQINAWCAVSQRLKSAASTLRAWLQSTLMALALLSGPAGAAVSTTTELSTSANPAIAGQPVVFSVKVLPSTATGTVTLYADGAPLASGSLSPGGTASITTSTTTVGTFQLQAVYSGDAGHQASSSSLLSQSVRQSTTISLNSSKNPAAVGEQVSITVSVVPPTASGTVNLLLNGAVLASGNLVNGSATISDTASVAGSYLLQANYAGDGYHAPSQSSTLNQQFGAGAAQSSTTKLTLSPSSIAVGQSSTIVVAVSPSTATGSVTLKDGTVTLQTLQLGSGAVASWIQSFGSAGNKSITAEYSGDATYAASLGTASLTVTSSGQPGGIPPSGPLSTSFGYNANGQLTTLNLPQGIGQPFARSQTQTYDTLGRESLTQLAPPALAASQPEVLKTWDGRDQLIGVQDPRKLNTTYSIDGLGQKLNQSSPDTGSGTANSTFWADGRLKTLSDARGKLFSYTWDGLGRPTQVSYSSGAATTFQYDNCTANAGSMGQLCKLTDESGNTTYSHDGFGRVLSKTQTVTYTPTGGSQTSRSFVLGQTWGKSGGATGKLQSQTYPSKTQVNYQWAANGQLSGISLNPVNAAGTATDTTKTVTVLSSLAYSGLGAVKSWSWGDGVAYSRGYDGLGRLQTYPLGNPAGSGNAAGLTRTVGYDDAGRISSFTHSGSGANPSAFDQTFGYDGLDRLTANQQATSYGYGYDASGNRNSLKVAGNTYAQTIAPSSNRVTTETNASGSKSLLYHLDGSLQSDGTYAYTYSDRGRLSRVTLGTATGAEVANYRYNGLEQRVVKYGPTTKVDGGARFYAYDEAGHLIGEYDKDGNPAYEVIYLGDTPVAVLTQTRTGSPIQVSTQVHYIYADHLNTPRVIVQSSNHAIRWRWDQAEAFGNSAANENPNALGTFSFNLRFPGQTFDKETGWHYNHHRDYRPGAGRYAQSDPIGLAGGINTYAYVGGNPTSRIDPEGLIWPAVFYEVGAYFLANAPWIVPAGTAVAEAGVLLSTGANSPSTAVPAAVSKLQPTAQAARALLNSSTQLQCKPATASGLNFSTAAAGHMDNPARYVPVQVLQQAIEGAPGAPDPRGSAALMHTIEMSKNEVLYKLEVLYNEATNTIYHFKYFRQR